MDTHRAAATNAVRRKPGRPRKPAPAPVITADCLAWPGALALAEGDASRVRVTGPNVAYTLNRPGLAGPPWATRNGRGGQR
jgi:hypothetical protein